MWSGLVRSCPAVRQNWCARRIFPLSPSSPRSPGLWSWLTWAALLTLSAVVVYAAYLDHQIVSRFESRRWSLPAQVYARPMELGVAEPVSYKRLLRELERAGYRASENLRSPGTYRSEGAGRLSIHVRALTFWDGPQPARRIRLGFDASGISHLDALDGAPAPSLIRLDPELIGSLYGTDGEDRVLVRLAEVPEPLLLGLLAVEDRHFSRHPGVDPGAVLRAALANLRAGRIVQGGSTLTQQLVKNLFLDSDRTFRRKFDEALMALLLEWHYDKTEILETYLNEVYLGQQGGRAIHGFGLASAYYFGKPLGELEIQELALLVGMVKGPTYYHPLRHPERARARRDTVLGLYAQAGLLDDAALRTAQAWPLGVRANLQRSGDYGAVLGLVRNHLLRDYPAEDLTAEGLRIYTTIDPEAQTQARQALVRQLDRWAQRGKAGLQGAVVVADVLTGEIHAVVGGRDDASGGLNRVLAARRPIGSLVKPAVYLAALESGSYTLVSPLQDEPVAVKVPGGSVWRPGNASGRFHGEEPLFQALAQSHNAATVHLGLAVGLPQVVKTLKALGVEADIPVVPALLLGVLELTPIEVTQMYQTLAGGGLYTPLRVIREVISTSGTPLRRYPLSMRPAASPQSAYLLHAALRQVMLQGTARAAADLPAAWEAAGKTGTTDDLRDAWFAGYAGDQLAVVWVGRDDNAPMGLAGASGALPIWLDVMRTLGVRTIPRMLPDGMGMHWVDGSSGRAAGPECPGAIQLPFREGSGPVDPLPCALSDALPEDANGPSPVQQFQQWWRGWLGE